MYLKTTSLYIVKAGLCELVRDISNGSLELYENVCQDVDCNNCPLHTGYLTHLNEIKDLMDKYNITIDKI